VKKRRIPRERDFYWRNKWVKIFAAALSKDEITEIIKEEKKNKF